MMHILWFGLLLIPTIASAEECTYIDANGVTVVANPGTEHAESPFKAGSTGIAHLLHYDTATNRPIWTREIFDQLNRIVFSGNQNFQDQIGSLNYPHSVEDMTRALQWGGGDLSKSRVAVISSLSPWVEHLLKRMGASRVTTFDHDPPIVCSGVSWVESKEFWTLNNEPGTYDLLVSFSGIEHYGLGAYGDPINPNADMEAMQAMYSSLKPGSLLILAVPTANPSHIEGVQHRIYGPDKLEELLNGFEFIGRVWDGHVLGGWSDVNVEPVLFPPSGSAPVVGRVDWRHQHVLILRKPIDEVTQTRMANVSGGNDNIPESPFSGLALMTFFLMAGFAVRPLARMVP